ncbi:MAG: threonylcarbamoyl-AMP synthase [Hyphomicrobiales bacterium]|nr:threonylcarbamoyl-AMP synthase [Hyphomicrobiales bacterium]
MKQFPSIRGAGRRRRKTRLFSPDAMGIDEAAALLRAGRLIAFPTETVYGLGADATNPRAVAALYAAKGRPSFNPLIAHLPDLDAAFEQGRFNASARALARAFWPGALTLVVPLGARTSVCELARAGLASVALRVPAHPLAHELLRKAGVPIAAPSANRSGHVSPTLSSHVMADLDGRIDAVINGGPTAIGLESTIVACLSTEPALLRAGGIPREAIETVVGKLGGHESGSGTVSRGAHKKSPCTAPSMAPDNPRPLSPGLLASHYAPRAKVRLEAHAIEPREAALLFGNVRPKGLEHAEAVLNLSETGDLTEAAANLFGHLRRLDAMLAGKRSPRIAVSPIPELRLGEAINDRLRRAAAGR